MDRQLRKTLDDCLERIRQGDSVEACLEAYPGYAQRLGPFLRAASILWGMHPPRPSARSVAAARSRLLERVAGGVGGKEAAVRGMLRFAHVAAMTVAALFVAGVGLVAAAGPEVLTAPFGGGSKPAPVTFTARVTWVGEDVIVAIKDDHYVKLQLSEKTRFESASGQTIGRTDIEANDGVFVKATPVRAWLFDAILVRLLGEEEPGPKPPPSPPEPTPGPVEPKPSPEPAAPAPTAVPPAPQPTTAPPPVEPAPVEVVLEGKVLQVGSASFVLKSSTGVQTTVLFNAETVFDGYLTVGAFARVKAWQKADGSILARVVTISPLEFWGTVLALSETSLTLKTDWGTTIVRTTGETVFVGKPFVGVKVWVLGYKQPDGSFLALKITVKTIEFTGTVQSIEGNTLLVLSSGTTYTVRTDGSTAFPAGQPTVGATVLVRAYRMGDGTYLAYEVKVKAGVFTGVIVGHLPEAFTIYVQVGSETSPREVCYEFAQVYGTLAAGKTVEVHVDHIEGTTYFAGLVKVLG